MVPGLHQSLTAIRHAGYMPNEQGTVVVIEDDSHIADLVDMYLRREGFRVIQAGTGEAGLAAIERERPRMAILDIGLPGGIDGMEVCQQLRAKHSLPVLMLTARDSELDRVLGLELGADDYVTKPFSPRELVARVKAILRRSDGSSRPQRGLDGGPGRGRPRPPGSSARRGGRAPGIKGVPAPAVPGRAAREGLVPPAAARWSMGARAGTATTARSTPMCASCERSSAMPFHSARSGAWATASGKGYLCADA